MKPLLVGEANPYGGDPYYALYPDPPGCAGWRLCKLIMQLEPDDYLERFERVNLCHRRWSIKEARVKAAEYTLQLERPALVLFGRKVCDAFGIEFKPFWYDYTPDHERTLPNLVILPHPSGLNRMWTSTSAFETARTVLRAAGVLP